MMDRAAAERALREGLRQLEIGEELVAMRRAAAILRDELAAREKEERLAVQLEPV